MNDRMICGPRHSTFNSGRRVALRLPNPVREHLGESFPKCSFIKRSDPGCDDAGPLG
jgi:hypothetical protein